MVRTLSSLTCVVVLLGSAAADPKPAPPPAHKPPKSEALIQLNKLGKYAKSYFITNAEFPKGKAKQLPEKACCAQPDHKCAVTKAWEKDSVWAALDFQNDEPNQFQDTLDSDGTTVVATAVGDPSCTGKPVTYTLEVKAVGGNPQATITGPK